MTTLQFYQGVSVLIAPPGVWLACGVDVLLAIATFLGSGLLPRGIDKVIASKIHRVNNQESPYSW